MTACQERIEVWEEFHIKEMRIKINDFIKTHVSKIVDFRINTVGENEQINTTHFAYIRYIPQ